MSNGDTLKFQMIDGVGNVAYTVTVKNVTTEYTTLDTFTCLYFEL